MGDGNGHDSWEEWAGVIWLWTIMLHIPLDILKLTIRYALSDRAWDIAAQDELPLHYFFHL